MSEQRECAARYCDRLFTPKRPQQIYCSRKCSFRSLYFSRHNSLWHEANESQDGKYSRARYARDYE